MLVVVSGRIWWLKTAFLYKTTTILKISGLLNMVV